MFCLFCGKEIKKRYEEYTPYYECDCEDAKKDREVSEKIRVLEGSRPRRKFEICLTPRALDGAKANAQSDNCPICNGDKYTINGLGLQEDCYFCVVATDKTQPCRDKRKS